MLGVLWWRSMPYHHEWLTLWAALWLWVVLIAGGASLFHAAYLMRFGTEAAGVGRLAALAATAAAALRLRPVQSPDQFPRPLPRRFRPAALLGGDRVAHRVLQRRAGRVHVRRPVERQFRLSRQVPALARSGREDSYAAVRLLSKACPRARALRGHPRMGRGGAAAWPVVLRTATGPSIYTDSGAMQPVPGGIRGKSYHLGIQDHRKISKTSIKTIS